MQTDSGSWNLGTRVLFRFSFIYVLIYSLPFPFSFIDGLDISESWINSGWDAIVPWVGKEILGIDYQIRLGPNGSGDTTADYVRMFIGFALATIGALVWSIVDRKRLSYPTLGKWTLVGTRYYLACFMVLYGMIKVFKSQFGELPLRDLVQPMGTMSPMGVVWNFMGHSTAYTFFAGFGEVLGGVLLFHRRTTTLGSLVSAGVMANVVMLNFCYDVPVKLFSSHLLLMSIGIALIDWRRLLVLIGKPSPGAPVYAPYFKKKALHISGRIVKWVFIIFILFDNGKMGYDGMTTWGDLSPKPPLYGLYETTCFQIDEEIQTPIFGEPTYMRRFAIDKRHGWTESLDEKKSYFTVEADEDNQTIMITPFRQASEFWTYTPTDEGMIVKGFWKGLPFTATMRHIPREDFLLINRGFNWVNEFPFNR